MNTGIKFGIWRAALKFYHYRYHVYDFDDLNYLKYFNYLNIVSNVSLNYAYMHRQLSQSDAHD